jgi:hypothetical protein
MTMRRIGWMAVLILGGVTGLAASEASFSGTWKLNLEKSQLAGQTLTIEKTASGTFHFDSLGFAYDFDLTGKQFPTPDGGTASFKAVDATTWETTDFMNGKVVTSYRMVLKGDEIVSTMNVTKPDGKVVEDTVRLTRISGGPGFLGKWKATEEKGTPTTLVILTSSPNRITVRYPEFKQVCEGSFDGKDYVLMTEGVPSKMNLAFEKAGEGSFRVATKLDGKPYFNDTYTLSADGKVLTDEGNSVSVNEPVKVVYDRQ